jgi:hypothetical protein
MCEPLSLKALISAEEYDKLALWDVPDELEDRKYNNLFVAASMLAEFMI